MVIINITQVETVDSFVEFLTSHMELWRIYSYPCLQPTPGQPGYKVCSWPWPWRPQSVVLALALTDSSNLKTLLKYRQSVAYIDKKPS